MKSFKLSPRQAGILVIGVLLLGGLYWLFSGSTKQPAPPQVTLVVWGTEPQRSMDPLFSAYTATRPNVKISYRAFDTASYEAKLLDALASGKGPDVVLIGNRDVTRMMGRLLPAPQGYFPLSRVLELYPSVVAEDVIRTASSSLYALPISMDTLSLLYRRDILDAAGIVAPPKTWTEFQDMMAKLTVRAESGGLSKAGAAIGGSARSMPYAPDLFASLALQNGVSLSDPERVASTLAGSDALRVLNFYLRFADPSSAAYTWSDREGNALARFKDGSLAMLFGYESDLLALQQANPFSQITAAPFPQLQGATRPITFARYQVLAVTAQSKQFEWAWDFVSSAATNESALAAYEAASGRMPALRSLIGGYLKAGAHTPFAAQALTARSWYDPDSLKVDQALDDGIGAVLDGRLDSARALQSVRAVIDTITQGR
jgi:multiple sugar transport system substrate-binding protein